MSVGLANKLVKFGNLAEAAKETKKERLDCASFGAGTQVRLPNGFQSIETLIKGQKVSSRHDGNYQDHSQAITSTFNRTADHYYRLVTEKNESFNVTAEHPIWLQGKGWTQAKDIKRADPIATQTGDILVLQNTRINQPLKVYNFSVANTPNYFVGTQGIWVHNAPCSIYLSPAKQELLLELQESGVKVTASKLVDIRRTKDGKIIFLEEGSSSAGLKHILEGHKNNFKDKGISEVEISYVVMKAAAEGKPVGKMGKDGVVYEITHNGEKKLINVVIGSNGYIVTAHPTKLGKYTPL